MKNVLLTLAALTALASTDAFAQRGRSGLEKPTTEGQGLRVNETTEQARARARKGAPGIRPQARVANEAAEAAKYAPFTKGLPSAEQNKIAGELKALSESESAGPLWSDFVTAISQASKADKIEINGTQRNNADAAVALIQALSAKGLLNKDGVSTGKFDVQEFLGKEGLTALKGTASRSFILTLEVAAKGVLANKSVYEAFYEAITRDHTDQAAKEAEMKKFCEACPGACK